MTSQPDYENLLGPPRQSIPILHVPTQKSVSARIVRLTGQVAFEYIKKVGNGASKRRWTPKTGRCTMRLGKKVRRPCSGDGG